MTDKVRVLRVVEYVGSREDVEKQIENSIHGTRRFRTGSGGEMQIRVATVGEYPEILEKEEDLNMPPGEYQGNQAHEREGE
jgi:hypothetical protein